MHGMCDDEKNHRHYGIEGTFNRDDAIGEPYWGLSMSILALKHTYQLRGMASSTLRMRTTISPRQWQPRTVTSPLLGLISMA